MDIDELIHQGQTLITALRTQFDLSRQTVGHQTDSKTTPEPAVSVTPNLNSTSSTHTHSDQCRHSHVTGAPGHAHGNDENTTITASSTNVSTGATRAEHHSGISIGTSGHTGGTHLDVSDVDSFM